MATAEEVRAQLTGPGAVFEIARRGVRGVPMKTDVAGPRSMRDTFPTSEQFDARPVRARDWGSTDCGEFYKSSTATEPAILRITLPREAALGALRDLESMGITSETMFPGLEGTARYAFVRSVDRHIWRGR
jgi:hypothetical protein